MNFSNSLGDILIPPQTKQFLLYLLGSQERLDEQVAKYKQENNSDG